VKHVDDKWQPADALSPNHPARVFKKARAVNRMHRGGHLMEPIKLFSSEEATRCYNCGKPLENQRCAGNTPNGPKWFCRQNPDSDPFESCYSHWRMRQSRQAS
jgi:hypothetical protein